MKFRDRLIKAEFWGDSFFFRLSAQQRLFFISLLSSGEDSGCLEFDSLLLKCQFFGSPADAEITPEIIEQWKNQLVEAGKLIPYQAGGKEYLFIKNFHKYQTLKHYSAPTISLPDWISFESTPTNPHQGKYNVLETIATTELGQTRPRVSLESPYNSPSLAPNTIQIKSNQINTNQIPPSAAQPVAGETGSLFSQEEDDWGKEPTLPPNQKTTKTTNKQPGDSRVKVAIDYYSEQFKKIHGSSPKVNYGREGAIIKDHLAHLDRETNHHGKSLEILKGLLTKFLNLEEKFLSDSGYSLNLFSTRFNGLRLSNRQANTPRKEVAKSGQSSELFYFNQPGR